MADRLVTMSRPGEPRLIRRYCSVNPEITCRLAKRWWARRRAKLLVTMVGTGSLTASKPG